MAHHESALKSIRQTKHRTERNRRVKSTMRTAIKKFRLLVEENKLDQARELLPRTFSVIDKSVTKGVLHRNAADRYKSRLTLGLNATAK